MSYEPTEPQQKPHQALRAEASRMAWAVTRMLKEVQGPDYPGDIPGYERMEPYLVALEWLVGFAADDSRDLAVVLELMKMPALPLRFDGQPGSQWNAFVRFAFSIAANAGLELPRDESRRPLAPGLWRTCEQQDQMAWLCYGLGRGWLLPRKKLLSKAQTYLFNPATKPEATS